MSPAQGPTETSTAAATVHPFYQRLLGDGSRALMGGDHQEAARQLRLAAFGLLDSPPTLVLALTQLALAQVAVGDESSATESISRVLDAERRFGAYEAAAAGLTLDVRREFEELLVQRFTEPQLRDLGSLARLGDARLERDLASLSPAERRVRLEELVAQSSGDARWNAQLAQMAIDANQLEAGVAYASRVLDTQPGDVDARCLRGVARAETGQCEGAVEDLAICPRSLEVERFALGRIDCLARLDRLDDASAALAALPPALLAQRSVRRLERSVADRIDTARRQASAEERRQAQLAAAAAREAERQARLEQRAGSAEADAGSEPGTEVAKVASPPVSTSPETASAAPPENTPVTTPEPASPREQPREQEVARRNRPVVVESGMPAAAEATATQVRRMAAEARSATDFEEPLQLARDLAERYGESRDAQHLAAEIAYRASRWEEAVEYFTRGGPPAAERPELSFYEAVVRYETGDLAGARAALDRALPQIQRTPFVDRYVGRIRAGASGSGR
ncbi:MAG TPA: hypothetical protein VNB06_21210 [Thermoanaerobaculia bacterium]|nr:hypothetical protein [Thermoanaerobaculia bacterium]